MAQTLRNSADQPRFISKQFEFAANIRHPDNPVPDDVDDQRMAVYRELFYNNVEDFIANSYPVIREITDDDSWHAMMRDYYARHQAKTPLFPTMPQEFLDYLQNERDNSSDPPFLKELAHYEWVELALALSDESITLDDIDPNADLMEGHPVLSPLALPLSYQYPVHQICEDYQPEKPGDVPTCIVVYRNRQDEMGFLEINTVTFRLLQLLTGNENWTGRQAVECVATELAAVDQNVIIEGGRQALESLKQTGIILGARTK